MFNLYLGKCNRRVKIRLMTNLNANRKKEETAALKAVIPKFAMRQEVDFHARSTSDIHDRIIFVDNAKCYIIGQSVKDAATKKPTYMVPIDSVSDMEMPYEDIWNRATVI